MNLRRNRDRTCNGIRPRLRLKLTLEHFLALSNDGEIRIDRGLVRGELLIADGHKLVQALDQKASRDTVRAEAIFGLDEEPLHLGHGHGHVVAGIRHAGRLLHARRVTTEREGV
jgi:hypothetical protein